MALGGPGRVPDSPRRRIRSAIPAASPCRTRHRTTIVSVLSFSHTPSPGPAMPRTTLRILALLAAATAAAPAPAQTLPAPPVARVVAKTDTMHGDVRVDNYFWLRDRSNAEGVSYLEAENRYTDSVMAPTRQLQETLYQEMLGRIKQTDLSVPDRLGPYFYYSRTEEGKQYEIMARKRGSLEAPEEVILDLNQMA